MFPPSRSQAEYLALRQTNQGPAREEASPIPLCYASSPQALRMRASFILTMHLSRRTDAKTSWLWGFFLIGLNVSLAEENTESRKEFPGIVPRRGGPCIWLS